MTLRPLKRSCLQTISSSKNQTATITTTTELAICMILTTIMMEFTIYLSDSMVALEQTHSTTTTTESSTSMIMMMTTTEFLKDQSIMLHSKHKDSILETFLQTDMLSKQPSTLGYLLQQRSVLSIWPINTHTTTITMA